MAIILPFSTGLFLMAYWIFPLLMISQISSLVPQNPLPTH